jgi:hypothetical protein
MRQRSSTSASAGLIEASRAAFDRAHHVPQSVFTQELWSAARRAGLLPLVASAFSARFQPLPDDVQRDVTGNAMRNVRAISELQTIQKLFANAGLRWLVLKGPVLSHVVSRVPGARVYGDIDVLVHPEDLEQCLDLLLESRASPLDRNWAHIRQTQQSEISVELERGTLLDLHWHPITDPRIRAEIGIDLVGLFRRSQQVAFSGIHAPTLDPLDTVCYTSLHAVLAGAHQLRWLIDVRECLIWADAPPEALRQRAGELGCLLAVEVIIGRIAARLDPGARAYLPRRRRSVWAAFTGLIDRFATLDPGPDAYSGRAIFSSTRASTGKSLIVCVSALRRARRAGPGRRRVTSHVSVLRREDGTELDRSAWLDLARGHLQVAPGRTRRRTTRQGGQG